MSDSTTDIGKKLASIGDTSGGAQDVDAGTYDSVTLAITNTSGSNQICKPKSSVYSIQLKKNAATASFEVKTGAKIVITAESSGATTTTYYTVSGAASGNDTVTGSGATDWKDLSLTATSDGTVTITIPSNQSDGSTANNNLRIQKITVTY